MNRTHDEVNPYAPPSFDARAVDRSGAESAPTDDAGLHRRERWVYLYYVLGLIDRITAVLLGLMFVGSIIAFLINPRGWLSLGKLAFALFCVERSLVIPGIAIVLYKIGCGLRNLSDRARRAQIGFSVGFGLLYFSVKIWFAHWNEFTYDSLFSLSAAWIVWIACCLAHVAAISLLGTPGARTRTTAHYRALAGPLQKPPLTKRIALALPCCLAAIGTFFGIWIICQHAGYALIDFLGD